MSPVARRVVATAAVLVIVAIVGWTYVQHLVPAVHEDHDHALENIAGGGFLRVEKAEGGRRNLVGKPKGALILHWFDPASPATAQELPMLVQYAAAVQDDPEIEIVLVAPGVSRRELVEWARARGVPTDRLHADPDGRTTSLIGVRKLPDTLVYGPDGRLVQQTRGPVDWSNPQLRAAVDEIKHGGGEHEH